MFAKLYTVAFLAVFAQSVFAQTCSRTYVVQDGDYCDGISAKNNVSSFQLPANNPSINKDCTNLTAGETLCLGIEGADCQTTHVVQPLDTCIKIAALNGVNMTIFRHNNPQLNDDCDIYVGEVVCTANTVQVPNIPAGGMTVMVNKGQSTVASTVVPLKASPTSPVAVPAHTTPSVNKPIANGVNSDSDDDDDLPFCDEL